MTIGDSSVPKTLTSCVSGMSPVVVNPVEACIKPLSLSSLVGTHSDGAVWGAGNVGQASAWQGAPGEGSIRVKPALLSISLRLARALNPTLLHLHFVLYFGLSVAKLG